jgi:hypothetical protein
MARMTPTEEAQYALTWELDRSGLSPVAQTEYDRLKQDEQALIEAGPTRASEPRARQDLIPGTDYSRAGMRNMVRFDRAVLELAVGVILAIAVINVVSWPGNLVLLSGGPLIALCVAPLVLCAACSIGSNIQLYGTPSQQPSEQWRAIYWGSRERPPWARLPPSMRRPPARTWLPFLLAAAGCALVTLRSDAAGMAEGDLRVLPGHRYQVSTIGLHNAAWTQVSAVQYHAYLANFVRESCFAMMPALAVIANASYLLYLRAELLRIRPG